MDKEVEKYIEKQQAPQKEILKKVRNLILESLTERTAGVSRKW